ncbi:hypothetical protein [Ferribacterium limneticum]|uniref:hypothetical protein n=1 Tax=Ferribacterium limneticum TaxID=76259 RepID=UPI001CF82E5B|nr:hypothetical protein [Ferribacterium limneticum]UCV26700.1 hypothetical protein KI617_10305 [Ferribacterium limneticum]UCV30617.1 hypothetical protein KI608_10305 [Ferribacterium limneticum]
MRPVTEKDFRRPEFMEANPDDYEFRADGAIVRKDRWEQGFRRIVNLAGCSSSSEFEIDDIIATVDKKLNPPLTILDDRVVAAVRFVKGSCYNEHAQEHFDTLAYFVEATIGMPIEEKHDA